MTWTAAVLAVCSTADPAVVEIVLREAAEVRRETPSRVLRADIVLAVAIVESGAKGGNPLGIGRAARRAPDKIRRGLEVLVACYERERTLWHALSVYHRGRVCPKGLQYADRVLAIASRLRALRRRT